MKLSAIAIVLAAAALSSSAWGDQRHGIVIDPVNISEKASGTTLSSSGASRYEGGALDTGHSSVSGGRTGIDRAARNQEALSQGRSSLDLGHSIDGRRDNIDSRARNDDALSQGRSALSVTHRIDGERTEIDGGGSSGMAIQGERPTLEVEHRIDGARQGIQDDSVNHEAITGERGELNTPLGFSSSGSSSGL